MIITHSCQQLFLGLIMFEYLCEYIALYNFADVADYSIDTQFFLVSERQCYYWILLFAWWIIPAWSWIEPLHFLQYGEWLSCAWWVGGVGLFESVKSWKLVETFVGADESESEESINRRRIANARSKRAGLSGTRYLQYRYRVRLSNFCRKMSHVLHSTCPSQRLFLSLVLTST